MGSSGIPKAELTGISGWLIRRMSRKRMGDVPDGVGAPAMVELTACVALLNFMARSNTALGLESHGLAAACELAPLAEPSGKERTPA